MQCVLKIYCLELWQLEVVTSSYLHKHVEHRTFPWEFLGNTVVPQLSAWSWFLEPFHRPKSMGAQVT
jgi:hypothetical protein